MIKEAIEKILDLKKPEQITVKNKTFYDNSYSRALDKYPDHLEINNLTGIVDFIKESPEVWKVLFVLVRDFNEVILYQSKSGDFNQRVAILLGRSRPCNFRFGSQLSIEEFIISLNGMFIENEDRNYLLSFVSRIKVDANSKIEDNGVSQTITARQGASSLVTDIEIKPIVKLQPFRTFNEISQPISTFVFRLKVSDGTPYCSLHACDGEAWKQTAIQSIKDYFVDQDINIPVIA